MPSPAIQYMDYMLRHECRRRRLNQRDLETVIVNDPLYDALRKEYEARGLQIDPMHWDRTVIVASDLADGPDWAIHRFNWRPAEDVTTVVFDL